jgi:hypothetical protein
MAHIRPVIPADRLAAAIALERARQTIREHTRYGFPVAPQHLHAVQAAAADYDLTTKALRH